MAADPAVGGPGDSAAIAAAEDAGSRAAQVRRRYFLAFLGCCLILPISIFVGIRAPNNSALAGWMGGIIGGDLVLVPLSLVAFVSTLSQRRRRRVRQVAWALVPIVSFTLLAWWPFLVVALIRLRVRDWAMLAAYLAAVAAEIVVVILSAQGMIPARAQIIIFFTTVLLVAVTAAVHTLVVFRPAAGLPRLTDAERSRRVARGDGSAMITPDADPGGPSGLEDSLPGPPRTTEPELDAYGLPVHGRPPTGRTYRLSLASLICGIVSAGLAITETVGHRVLPGYLVALGMVSGLLAAAVGNITAETIPKSGKGKQIAVVRRICRGGFVLGVLGLIGMVIASGHGAVLNDVP